MSKKKSYVGKYYVVPGYDLPPTSRMATKELVALDKALPKDCEFCDGDTVYLVKVEKAFRVTSAVQEI